MPARRKELKIKGADFWCLVGLITSDGNLSKDGRHVDITPKERNFLQMIKEQLKFTSRVCIKNEDTDKQAYRIQIANKNLYDFLLSIGLMQNKSLIVGPLNIPRPFFVDFLRGVIDGDGCIRKWIHPSNHREQWSLRIYSGSPRFTQWLSDKAELLLQIRGKIHKSSESVWVLKYGKMAAKVIAEQCYYKECLGLDRKIKLAQGCFGSYAGWNKSKAVLN